MEINNMFTIKTETGEINFNFTKYFSTEPKRYVGYHDDDCRNKKDSVLVPNPKKMLDIMKKYCTPDEIAAAFESAREDLKNMVNADVFNENYNLYCKKADSKAIAKMRILSDLCICNDHLVGFVATRYRIHLACVISKESCIDSNLARYDNFLKRFQENTEFGSCDNFKQMLNLLKISEKNGVEFAPNCRISIDRLKKISKFVPKGAIFRCNDRFVIIENKYYYIVIPSTDDENFIKSTDVGVKNVQKL